VGVGLNRSVAVITDLEDRTAAVIDVERIVAHRNEGVALGRRATMMNPELPVVVEVVEEGHRSRPYWGDDECLVVMAVRRMTSQAP